MFAWNIKCSIFFKIYLFSLCYPGLKPWDITLTLKFHWNIWAAVFVISNLSCNIASTVAPFFWPPICYVWPPFYFRSPKGSFKETWVWGTACFVFFSHSHSSTCCKIYVSNPLIKASLYKGQLIKFLVPKILFSCDSIIFLLLWYIVHSLAALSLWYSYWVGFAVTSNSILKSSCDYCGHHER